MVKPLRPGGGGGGGVSDHGALTGLGDNDHPQYQLTSEKGQANGYASLDGSSKIPSAQIPDLAVTEFLGTVANEAAMLALTGEKGDWCVRSDDGKNYVITGSDPSVVGDWTALSYPGAPVVSVNGATGAVTITASDLGAVDTSTNQTVNGEKTFSNLKPTAASTMDLTDAAQVSVPNSTDGDAALPRSTIEGLRDNVVGLPYAFSTSTGAMNPGVGRVRFNGSAIGTTTLLYISSTARTSDTTLDDLCAGLKDGDVIRFQVLGSATVWVSAKVSGAATDNTGWWTVPVDTPIGTLPADNDAMMMSIWFSGAAAGGGGSPWTEMNTKSLLYGGTSTANTMHVNADGCIVAGGNDLRMLEDGTDFALMLCGDNNDMTNLGVMRSSYMICGTNNVLNTGGTGVQGWGSGILGGYSHNAALASGSGIVNGYDHDITGSCYYTGINYGYQNNIYSADASVINGGYRCTIDGISPDNDYMMINGGYYNEAHGDFSSSQGHYAHADHDGTWIWADAENTTAFATDRANQFKVKAAGGFTLDGYQEYMNTAESTPPADRIRVGGRKNGSNKMELIVTFPDGTTTVLATEP